jgi:hypothetical protein
MKRLVSIYNRYFLSAELAISLTLTLAAIRLDLGRYVPTNSDTIYVALTASFVALLGFVITGISVILAFGDSERLALLRKSRHYPLVFKVFVSAAKFLGVGFISSFLGLIVDRKSETGMVIAYLTLFTVFVAIFRVYRCVWVLDNVIEIVTKN